jgi:hypothetical protein
MSGLGLQDFSLAVNSFTGYAWILNPRITVSEAAPLFLALGRWEFSETRGVNQFLQIGRHTFLFSNVS